MKRTPANAIAALAGTLAAAATAASEPSAADILARNVAARGGLEAWQKVETMVWMGHIESEHAPAPNIRFQLDQKRPNKTRLQIDALGERSMRTFDGLQGWKMRAAQGQPEVLPYTSQELAFARAGHGIDGPLLDHAARGSAVTLEGVEDVGGHRAYHLRVHPAKGANEEVWVDADTYLDLRHDRTAEEAGAAPRRVSAIYGDYREVDGLKLPFRIETAAGPGAPDRMQIEQVFLNVPLEDSTFGGAVQGRSRSRSAARTRAAGAAPGTPAGGPADTRR